MSAKRQELRIVADRFRKTPESDRWEKIADSLNGLEVVNTPRELVLFEALVLALDARDSWKKADADNRQAFNAALLELRNARADLGDNDENGP